MTFGELRSWIRQRQVFIAGKADSLPDAYEWRLEAEYLAGFRDALGEVDDKISEMERLEQK